VSETERIVAILVAVFGVGGVGALFRYIANLRDKRLERVELAKLEVVKAETVAKQRIADELAGVRAEVYEFRVEQAIVIERDRRRDAKRKREALPPRRGPQLPPREDFRAEEATDVDIVGDYVRQKMKPAIERRKTPAPGVPIVRAGTQRDEDR